MGDLIWKLGLIELLWKDDIFFFLNSERFFLFLVNFFEDFLINDSLLELEAALVDGAYI